MKLTVYSDQRFSVARGLLVSMLGKKDIQNTIAMINENNELICVVRETAIFVCHLGNITPGFSIYIDCESTFDKFGDDNDPRFIPILDIRKINQINGYYKMYISNKCNYPLIFHKDNMEEDPVFAEYLASKSAEGAKFYKGISNDLTSRFLFPVFSGFPKLLKKDTLNLFIYNMDIQHNMVEMVIHKSKLNKDISLIYRILNIV